MVSIVLYYSERKGYVEGCRKGSVKVKTGDSLER